MTRDNTILSVRFPTTRRNRLHDMPRYYEAARALTITQPSARHKVTVTGPAWAFTEIVARLRAQAQETANNNTYGYADPLGYEALANEFAEAKPAPVTTEPAAPAPVTTEPETTEPAAPLAPVTLGTSPAGVEWVVYPKSTETESEFHARVQVGRERLAALHAKQAPATKTAKTAKTAKTLVTLSDLCMFETMALRSVSRACGLQQTAPRSFTGTRQQMINAHRMLKSTDLRGMEWNTQSAYVCAAARLALAGYESEDTRPASEWINAR